MAVPTMFIRLLALPEYVRKQYDLSSLKTVLHAAAPCPIPIKQAMIEWLGPIIEEFYSGSEGIGHVTLNSEEWLAHVGSVGRAVIGTIHICDDDGNELPAGETARSFSAEPSPSPTTTIPQRPRRRAIGFTRTGRQWAMSVMLTRTAISTCPTEKIS